MDSRALPPGALIHDEGPALKFEPVGGRQRRNKIATAILPDFDFDNTKITATAKIDTLVVEAQLDQQRPWNWLRPRLKHHLGSDIFIKEIMDDFEGKSHSTKLRHRITIQDPSPLILHRLRSFGSPVASWGVTQLDVCIDYRITPSSVIGNGDAQRNELLIGLFQLRRLDHANLDGKGGPRLYNGGGSTLLRVPGSGGNYRGLTPDGSTIYYGEKGAPGSGKLYHKVMDGIGGANEHELGPPDRVVRDEVTVAGALLDDFELKTLDGLTSFPWRRLSSLFRYYSMTFTDAEQLRAVHNRYKIPRAQAGAWAVKEKRPDVVRPRGAGEHHKAHALLNRKAGVAWRGLEDRWHAGFLTLGAP